MLDIKIPTEKVSILQPLLHHAMDHKVSVWPAFDGTMLDRTQFVSSSEIGKCAREIWFGKNLPLQEGKFKWGFAERGHGHEAWVVERLRSVPTEYEFKYMGDEQVSFYDGYQSGTPDGLWRTSDGNTLFEHKSIDPRTNMSKLPKPEHLLQVTQNMDLVEACEDITIDGGLLAYSNASDFSTVTEFWVDRHSPTIGEAMEALERRAETIMQATSAEDVEPEGIVSNGCMYCAFKAECSAAVMATKQERVSHENRQRTSAKFFG